MQQLPHKKRPHAVAHQEKRRFWMGSVSQREHLQTVADDKAIAAAVREVAVQIFWVHAASVPEMVLCVDSKSLRVQRRSKFCIAGAVLQHSVKKHQHRARRPFWQPGVIMNLRAAVSGEKSFC